MAGGKLVEHGLLLADNLVNRSGHEEPSVSVRVHRDQFSTTTRTEIVLDIRMVLVAMRRRTEVVGTGSVAGNVPRGALP